MKIKKQLYLSFMVLFVISAVFGAITLWQARAVTLMYSSVKKKDLKAVRIIDEISHSISKINDMENEMLHDSEENIIKKIASDINEFSREVKAKAAAYRKIASDQSDMDMIDEFTLKFDSYMKFSDELFAKIRSGEFTNTEVKILNYKSNQDYESMQELMRALKEQEISNLMARIENSAVFHDRFMYELSIMFIALILTGFVIAVFFSGTFSETFDRIDERYRIEKLKSKISAMFRMDGKGIDHRKLLYFIAEEFGARATSLLAAENTGHPRRTYSRKDSYAFSTAPMPESGGDWNIESLGELLVHAERLNEPVIYETADLFGQPDEGVSNETGTEIKSEAGPKSTTDAECVRAFAGTVKANSINSILIFPLIKSNATAKHFVFYFDRAAASNIKSMLSAISEVINETGLLLDNMELLDELHEKSAQLYERNAELEAYARTVAHDLKNPLNSVAGYYQMIDFTLGKAEVTPPERLDELRSFAGYGLKASALMQGLIDDILVFSCVKSMTPDFRGFSSKDAALKAVSFLDEAVKNAGAQITVDDSLPEISADRSAIERVFMNLISNSVKYMGEGKERSVRVGYGRDGSFHKFFVADTGIGIGKPHQHNIFKPFFRSKEKQKAEGTGLGLAITRKIVEKHGGRIWFESDGISGTTFYFTIPVGPCASSSLNRKKQ